MEPADATTLLSRLLQAVPDGAWWALDAFGAADVWAIIVASLFWLGVRGWRLLFWSLTLVGLLAAVGFGVWTAFLPEVRGSVFVLEHQFVRVGAALGVTLFVFGAMCLAFPHIMNTLEGRGFSSQVAVRHVRAKKSGFLTAMSVLSIAGVGLSTFALCAVISIHGGFGEDLKRKILSSSPQILIDTPGPNGIDDWRAVLERVRETPGVAGVTPLDFGKAIASHMGSTAGVVVNGVDTESVGATLALPESLEFGRMRYLEHPEELLNLPEGESLRVGLGGELYKRGPPLDAAFAEGLDVDVREALRPTNVLPGVLIGRDLSTSLNLGVGDTITLVAALGDLGPMGLIPRRRDFRVAGIFYTGMYEYDASFVYMNLATAAAFLDLGENVSGLGVKLTRPEDVKALSAELERELGAKGLRVRDWQTMNRSLFSALKLEKVGAFLVLVLTIIVASFCIACTLLLSVEEKSKEIAILKALGATNGGIIRIFMTEGAMIGGIGTVYGVVLGFVACFGLQWFGVRIDPEVYHVDRLPISIVPGEYLMIALASMGASVLVTIAPAYAASLLRPVDGLRYE